MRCSWACVIAAGLVGKTVAFGVEKAVNGIGTEFEGTLTPEQLVRYKQIVEERCLHAKTGYLVGLLCAFVMCERRYGGECKLSNMLECEFVAIAFGVATLTYLILPKSDYMVYSLTSRAQMTAWMDMYRRCQALMVGGSVLGAGLYHIIVCQLSD